MRYNQISSELFIKNRKKVISKLPKNSIAIIHSNDQMPRNGDLYFPYRQNSDFFYLTGIEQEKSILVLFPGETDVKKQAALFLLTPKPELEIWEGKKLSVEEAYAISGISSIHYEENFGLFITKYLQSCKVMYLNKNENPRLQTHVRSRDDRFARIIRKRFPEIKIQRLAPILWGSRLIKEPEEIECITKACEITTTAFKQLLPNIKAGMKEYQIEGIMTDIFLSHGANGHAFEPIIASGKNTCFLHYVKNNQVLQNGDLLLLDFGAEYANYASDCSRTIPISGIYSQRQKQVYEAVLRIMKQTTQLIQKGTTISKYHTQTIAFVEEELLQLGLITKEQIANQTLKKPAYFNYFMHGVSHFMGLDTHDVGNKDEILMPGMVVTCEPGIYIPSEGIGIRLENDILITETGNIDLLADIPIECEEIEQFMSGK